MYIDIHTYTAAHSALPRTPFAVLVPSGKALSSALTTCTSELSIAAKCSGRSPSCTHTDTDKSQQNTHTRRQAPKRAVLPASGTKRRCADTHKHTHTYTYIHIYICTYVYTHTVVDHHRDDINYVFNTQTVLDHYYGKMDFSLGSVS